MTANESLGAAFLERRISLSVGFAIFAVLTTHPDVGISLDLGLDPAYAYALNRFFAEGVRFGSATLFTFGPLGFLLFPSPIDSNLEIGVGFWLSIHAALAFTLSLLVIRWQGDRISIASYSVALLGSLLLFNSTEFEYFLPLLVLSLALLHVETHGIVPLGSAVLVAALSFLIKISFGVLSCVLLASVLSLFSTRLQDAGLALVKAAVGVVFCVLCLWGLLYGDLSGLKDFSRSLIEFSSGHTSAMTVSYSKDWLSLGFAPVLYLACTLCLLRLDQNLFKVAVCIGLGLALWFKFAIVREGHIFGLLELAFALLIYVTLLSRNTKTLIVTIVLLASFYVLLQRAFIATDTPLVKIADQSIADKLARSIEFDFDIFRYARFSAYKDELVADSTSRTQANVLPASIIQIVGNATVDSYPWKTTFFYANSLRWTPRPVFQSYIAYTPWLDGKNAEFFRSDRSPRFLIWHDRTLISIDGRYLLNDEPDALWEILSRYRLICHAGDLRLFERSPQRQLRQLGERKQLLESVHRWRTWIDVPEGSGIIGAKIRFERTLTGQLRRLLYKEDALRISYKLKNEKVIEKRIIPDNAVNGVWVSPYLAQLRSETRCEDVGESVSIQDRLQPRGEPYLRAGQEVVEIKFDPDDAEHFRPHFDIEWTHSRIY